VRALVLAIALSGCAGARWTAFDAVLESTALATTTVDYVQTRQITDDCREMNLMVVVGVETFNVYRNAVL